MTFFNSEERITKLLYVAGVWKDTPWAANSASRGMGVSCHNLPRQIYMECGALPKEFPEIQGDPAKQRHAKESMMAKYIDGRPEFRRLAEREQPVPGDLLGIRIGRVVNHLGVVLTNNSFIHVLMHKNTCIDLMVSPWLEHVGAIWRIEA